MVQKHLEITAHFPDVDSEIEKLAEKKLEINTLAESRLVPLLVSLFSFAFPRFLLSSL
jgi:hypothetical protein